MNIEDLAPDVCEIGYTWLARSAIRTAANTQAKSLMPAHAFETWQVLRVNLHNSNLSRLRGFMETTWQLPAFGKRPLRTLQPSSD